MILEALLRLFFGLGDFLLGLLPDVDLSIDLSSIGSVGSVVGYLDNFIDVNVVLAVLGLGLIVNNWQFISNAFNWLIRKIPGVG